MKQTILILTALTLASAVSAGEIAVSSLDLTKAVQGNWKAVANKSTVKGKPITLGGVVYTNGIGARTIYRLVIDCHGTAKRFKAIVGVNDEGDKRYDNVVFYVEGDGKLLWKSPVMKVGSKPATIDVDLTGVKELVLWLRNGDVPGMGGDGPGDWANATITYDGEAPVAVDGTIPRKILTPAEPLKPRINGPRVFGARPGNPFQFYVPVTGERPLKVTAEELPPGLSLDSATGIITGTTPAAGTYEVKLTATNARGSATRELKIVAGETLALTPPMGWNSWNFYNRRVTQAIMSAQAQAMAASGLRDHGYVYEQYTEMSLWCIMAAPLILGCDLTKIDEFTRNLLCNDEVLEVNQDPLGRMANCVATCGETKVYGKEMSDGSLAVGLFNLGDETVPVSATWAELKLPGPQFVRDLWRQQNLGKQTDGFTAEIPRHGVMLIRVSPAK